MLPGHTALLPPPLTSGLLVSVMSGSLRAAPSVAALIAPELGWERLVKTFHTAAATAADRGVRVVYEFEPGFAFNKPSEILRLVDDVADDGSDLAAKQRGLAKWRAALDQAITGDAQLFDGNGELDLCPVKLPLFS